MATQPLNKAERIEAYVRSFGLGAEGFDPCYLAYFVCFNAQEYYEAHDVLEHLWLQREDENHAFFKGLIQFAGAFVHLKKQSARPWHRTDGRRMRPAVRLFALASRNLSPYSPRHMGLDVSEVLDLATDHVARIEASDFSRNPWNRDRAETRTSWDLRRNLRTAARSASRRPMRFHCEAYFGDMVRRRESREALFRSDPRTSSASSVVFNPLETQPVRPLRELMLLLFHFPKSCHSSWRWLDRIGQRCTGWSCSVLRPGANVRAIDPPSAWYRPEQWLGIEGRSCRISSTLEPAFGFLDDICAAVVVRDGTPCCRVFSNRARH